MMPELRATFFDVGQGDAAVVELPEGSGMLVDCPLGSAPMVIDYLERAQITDLELLVVTHSDLDHAGDVIGVVRGFSGPVRRLAFLPDRPLAADTQTNVKYRALLQQLAELLRDGTKSWHPYAGNAIQFGNVKVSVLHPSEADHLSALSRSDPNASSVVLKIECSEASILLGADVERVGWKAILDRGADLNADVFKFPHHGAWYDGTPSLQQILDQVNPSLVVISVGSTNSYGHPSVETLNLLRSYLAKVRFVCTQATTRCHGNPNEIAHEASRFLPDESLGGQSSRNKQSCPCAGNVAVRITSDGVAVSPTPEQHSRVIDLFDNPQCR